MKHILIVEDDTTFAVMLQTWLSKKKFSVASVSGIAAAKKTLIESSVDLVLCDLRLPDGDGIDLLEWVSNRNVNVPLIVMTSYAAIPSAVQAMKLGARDYISKPVNPEDLLQKINEVFNAGVKTGKQIPVSESVPEETNYLEGQSEAARQLYTYVKLVAPTSMSVLINGASGTGKEYVAKRIHQLSKRSEKPFVAIDCGAIPKELAASEFFGHKKGSFTGAIEDKVGAFIEADGGTIFLDEIGNLSYDVQVQLLRVLQERRVKPIGTTTEVKVDVRLIAATNEDLKAAIKSGAFTPLALVTPVATNLGKICIIESMNLRSICRICANEVRIYRCLLISFWIKPIENSKSLFPDFCRKRWKRFLNILGREI